MKIKSVHHVALLTMIMLLRNCRRCKYPDSLHSLGVSSLLHQVAPLSFSVCVCVPRFALSVLSDFSAVFVNVTCTVVSGLERETKTLFDLADSTKGLLSFHPLSGCLPSKTVKPSSSFHFTLRLLSVIIKTDEICFSVCVQAASVTVSWQQRSTNVFSQLHIIHIISALP